MAITKPHPYITDIKFELIILSKSHAFTYSITLILEMNYMLEKIMMFLEKVYLILDKMLATIPDRKLLLINLMVLEI